MVLSSVNSSSTPLNAGDTFTGDYEDIRNFSILKISVKTNVDCIVYIDHSIDGDTESDPDHIDTINLTSSNDWLYYRDHNLKCRFVRVRIANDETNQTFLRLQTRYFTGDSSSLKVDNNDNMQVGIVKTINSTYTYKNINLKSTGQSITSSASLLTSLIASNNSNSIKYLRIYNKSSAASDSDDSSGSTFKFLIPLQSYTTINMNYNYPIEFSSGISIRATTGITNGDTGDPSNYEVVVNMTYTDL